LVSLFGQITHPINLAPENGEADEGMLLADLMVPGLHESRVCSKMGLPSGAGSTFVPGPYLQHSASLN
jgi:hypothetical protein